MAVRWNDWEYGSEVTELRALYEKGKDNQWNASHDIDWSIPLTNDEFIAGPELSLLGNVTKMMGKDEATQKAAMFDEIAWVLSQLLHGEQAALQICGQLTNLCPTTDEKFYAANQVYDEARHTEVFARLLGEKFGTIYPISPNLKVLLDELLSVEGYTMKCLGMQTLFEGTAVGIMDQFRANSRNALITDVIRRVEQDESRHAAFGVLTMRRVVKRSSEAEMAAHGGLGVRGARGAEREPAARHAARARSEVRDRARRRRRHGDVASRVEGVQQPAVHAHGRAEPAAPRPDHRAHRVTVARARDDGRIALPRAGQLAVRA